jgi:hypothetical protein
MSRSQPQTERRKLRIPCPKPFHPGRSSAARVAPAWWHFPPFPKSSRLAKSSSHDNPLLHEPKPPSRTPPERHVPYLDQRGSSTTSWKGRHTDAHRDRDLPRGGIGGRRLRAGPTRQARGCHEGQVAAGAGRLREDRRQGGAGLRDRGLVRAGGASPRRTATPARSSGTCWRESSRPSSKASRCGS